MFIERIETIKSEMYEKILSENDEEDIIVLKISAYDFENTLNWLDAKEFELNGKMYDAIKIEKRSNLYIIYCFNDITEELLISNYNKLNDINREYNYCISGNHHLITLQAVQNNSWTWRIFYRQNYFLLSDSENFSSLISDVQTPPPKHIA